jgi:hypothetical protein
MCLSSLWALCMSYLVGWWREGWRERDRGFTCQGVGECIHSIVYWRYWLTFYRCRAIPQAVIRWLPTAEPWVRARVCSCGIFGGQSGAGAGFLRVLRIPLPILIPPIAAQSPSIIIWGWYNRPVMAAVPSALSLTPLTIKGKGKAIPVTGRKGP